MDAESTEVVDAPLFPKPLKIAKVIAPIKYKRNVVRAIEELGQVEPIEVDPRTGADELEIEDRRNKFEDYRSQLDRYLNYIDKEMIGSSGPISIGKTEESVSKYVDNVINNKLQSIQEIVNRKEQIEERENELEYVLNLLEKVKALDIEDTGVLREDTDLTHTFLGTLFPGQIQRLYWEIDEITDSRYFILDRQIDKENTVVLISVLKDDQNPVDSALKTLNFQTIQIPEDVDLDGLTNADVNAELAELQSETIELDNQLDELASKHGYELMAALELCNIELNRISVEQKMRRTETTAVMWAWIPENLQETFRTQIHEATEGSASFDFRKGDFDPELSPSYVENSEFMQPMRTLVSAYGTPAHDEPDPYKFVMFLFPILFGIMFADVGHGLVLTLLGLYFYNKKRKMDEIPEGLMGFVYGGAELMIVMGATSAIIGIPFNSFFGDETILWEVGIFKTLFEGWAWKFLFKLDPVTHHGHETYEISRNYVSLLILSFVIGAIVIIMGLILNLYKLKYFRHGDAELYAAWTLFGTYIFAILTFVFFAVQIDIGVYASIGLLVISLLSTLIIEFRAHGVDGLMLGVDHLLSLMSNTFSFGRLLAMNTIHFVLAFLPYLFIDKFTEYHTLNHYIGYWTEVDVGMWAVAAFIGTLIVVPVETVFSSLQSLRLNWVEFFGKFYSGDGTPFEPVKNNRKFTIEN